jgi:hypothetical protein
MADVAARSVASCGESRFTDVADPISCQSQVVASDAALPNHPAMFEKASLAAAVVMSLMRQTGLRAFAPVQLTFSPP